MKSELKPNKKDLKKKKKKLTKDYLRRGNGKNDSVILEKAKVKEFEDKQV